MFKGSIKKNDTSLQKMAWKVVTKIYRYATRRSKMNTLFCHIQKSSKMLTCFAFFAVLRLIFLFENVDNSLKS